MATFKKYPVYAYDEPATYDSFKGGINLDPSSENLADNEMRDCVNMEYSHVTLKKRKGAKRICKLISKEPLNFIQGITIFTKNNSFIVIAADGKLYYSLFIKDVDLELIELPIFDFKLTNEEKINYGVVDNDISNRTLSQFTDLPHYNYIRPVDVFNNGYVYDLKTSTGLVSERLIFQNKNKIEFSSYNNRLYVATGTRLVVVDTAYPIVEGEFADNNYYNDVELTAVCAAPYIPNGVEYQIYGENFMSPYPYECIRSGQGAAAAIKNIIFYPNDREDIADAPEIINKDIINCTASMIYPSGKGPKDYFFKWEIYDYSNETKQYRWRTLIPFKDPSINYNKNDNKITFVRQASIDIYPIKLFYKTATKPTSDDINIFVTSIKDENEKQLYSEPFARIMVTESLNNTYYVYNSNNKTWENKGKFVLFKDNENNFLDITSGNVFYIHTGDKAAETGGTEYDGIGIGNIILRCSFTDSLSEDSKNPGVWIPTKVDGSYFGTFQAKPNIEALNNTESTWRIIQSCKKILSDGNKFILYDDAYNSGSWFKTVIGKPGYITNRGSLNFKTNKNEQLIKVVHFKGILVAFAHNKLTGGNISIISGNGDDDPMDQAYSPYIRKVVNSEITCDNPYSIQIAENLLFFKFRDTVYAIEGSNISSEIITLYSMNDRLKQNGSLVNIPWDEECISEITEDYYGLIWKEKISYDNGEAFVERPAMRLKMYYKIGQEIDGKIFFPWLRDESSTFNTDAIINIDGISTHLRDLDLLQYHEECYKDIDKSYDCSIKLKAYDLNYPKISKFVRNVLLYYGRVNSSPIDINLEIRNEADNLLIDQSCVKDSIQDEGTLNEGVISGKTGTTYTDTKVYNSKYMFPLLQAVTSIIIKCDNSFSISSITFNYYTTDTPDRNQFDEYIKIKRKSEVISKTSINIDDNGLETDQDNKDLIEFDNTPYQEFFTGVEDIKVLFIILNGGSPLNRFNKTINNNPLNRFKKEK